MRSGLYINNDIRLISLSYKIFLTRSLYICIFFFIHVLSIRALVSDFCAFTASCLMRARYARCTREFQWDFIIVMRSMPNGECTFLSTRILLGMKIFSISLQNTFLIEKKRHRRFCAVDGNYIYGKCSPVRCPLLASVIPGEFFPESFLLRGIRSQENSVQNIFFLLRKSLSAPMETFPISQSDEMKKKSSSPTSASTSAAYVHIPFEEFPRRREAIRGILASIRETR